MTVDEAVVILDKILGRKHLSYIYELVFRQSWQGKTYGEIALESGYDPDYIKEVGSRLWNILTEAFDERVTKKNFQSVLRRYLIDKETIAFQTSGPTANVVSQVKFPQNYANQDWGDAIDVSVFHGRMDELTTLEEWIVRDRCRMVALLGIGGIGKTALSITLAEEIQCNFNYIIWRSLRNAPSVMSILETLIQFLSDRQETNLPTTLTERTACLMKYLRKHRCLIVLDGVESIIRSADLAGSYLKSHEGYSEMFGQIGESPHQSSLIVTSREQPREFAILGGSKVRSLYLRNLNTDEGQAIFREKAEFSGSQTDWEFLIARYAGNPLILKIVASIVQEFFDGNISRLVDLLRQDKWVFAHIRELLDRHFERLSKKEKRVMYWLAENQQLLALQDLPAHVLPTTSLQDFLKVLDSLRRRSLIIKKAEGFALPYPIEEYVIDRLKAIRRKMAARSEEQPVI